MNLLLIIGPPAVGKMTVGQEIIARSDFRLFHNHHTIEPLAEIFGYGTKPFNVLNFEFRRRVIEEAAGNDLDLIFSFVWDLADPADTTYVERLIEPYGNDGGNVWILELIADLDTRLERNRGTSRLAAKPSKQDLKWSDQNLQDMEALNMDTNTSDSVDPGAADLLAKHPHLRLDTNTLAAGEVAQIALRWLNDSASSVSS